MTPDLLSLLGDLLDYMQQRADVDLHDERFVGNEEECFARKIEEVLTRLDPANGKS